jgi:hypothetical protein
VVVLVLEEHLDHAVVVLVVQAVVEELIQFQLIVLLEEQVIHLL